jgi:hypothetical protein
MQFFFNAFIAFSFCVAGVFVFYALGVKSLRDGKAKSRWGEFGRQTEPFSFWFLVVFGTLGGLLACCMAIFVLLHPIKI